LAELARAFYTYRRVDSCRPAAVGVARGPSVPRCNSRRPAVSRARFTHFRARWSPLRRRPCLGPTF